MRKLWSYDIAWAPLEYLTGERQATTPGKEAATWIPGPIWIFIALPALMLGMLFLAVGIAGSILTGIRNLVWCHRLQP